MARPRGPTSSPPDLGTIGNAILDAADTMVVLTDRDGTILYVNRAFTAVTGYERDEAIGGTPRLLRSGMQSDDFYRDLWTSVLAGKTWHGELINRRKDGSLYTDEMTIVPLGPEDEPPDYFVAVKRDMSARLERLTSSSPVGVAHVAADGRLLYVNRQVEELLGATFDELTGKQWLDTFEPDGAEALVALVEAAGAPQGQVDGTGTRRARTRSGRWVEVHGAPLVGEDRASFGVVLALGDVTAEVAATDASAERERFARSILNALPDATAVVDGSGVIVAVNEAWRRFGDDNGGDPAGCGVGADYLGVCTAAAAAGCAEAALVGDALAQILAGQRESFETEYACPSPSEERWFLERISPIERNAGAVLLHVDITWRKQAEDQAAYLSRHDPLTGLLNRAGLDSDDDLLGVVFLDLDGFKQVNDRLGHTAGDAVLVHAAERIRNQVRTGDDVVRMGGDEFAVVIRTPMSRDAIEALGGRIERALSAPYELAGGATAVIGASVGYATVDDGAGIEAVLRAADDVMYREKRRHHRPSV